MLSMKSALFIVMSLLLPLSHFAQDTIIKRTAEQVLGKVLEISPTEVKYKKFNLPDGPTYIDKKSDIRMIIYSNGTKELFEAETPKKTVPDPENDYYSAAAPKQDKIVDLKTRYHYQNRNISQAKMQKILLATNDKEIKGLIMQSRDSKKFQLIGFASIPLGLTALYCLGAAGNPANTGNSGSYLLASGLCVAATVACPIIGGIQKRKKVRYNSRAIEIYNQKY